MTNLGDFLNTIKPIKFWHIKDTYYFLQSVGNHWFLKKYLVLYNIFLVRDSKLTDEVRIEIRDNFLSFCNNIKNPKKKEAALKYFFNPIDYRKKIKVLDFNTFNDLEGKGDIAANLFFIRLLGIGGQSGEKASIKSMLFQNKKMSEIFGSSEKLLEQANIDRKKRGKGEKGASASSTSILRDQVGSIRNYRQTFTLWGFVPNEEDGYDLNDISKFISKCNDELFIAALGDHQKFKMKLGRVEEDLIYLLKLKYKKKYRNPSKFFNQKSDFDDFNVIPSIALIEILNELEHFSFDEFNFIINRISPFSLEKVVSLIKEVRKNRWPEGFSRKEDGGNGGNGDLKQLQNFLYGYNFTKNPLRKTDPIFSIKEIINLNSFIDISNREIKVTNKVKFDYYYNFLLIIKKYLLKKYKNLFFGSGNQFKDNILIRLNELILEKKVDDNREYIENLSKLINLKINKENFQDSQIVNEWKKYLNNIDAILLFLTYALNFSLVNFEKLKKNINSVDIEFPSVLEGFLEKSVFTNNIKILIKTFFEKKKDFDFSNLKKIQSQDNENNFDYSNLIETNTPSEIIDILKKKNQYNMVFSGERIIRNRNTALMNYAKKLRGQKKVQGVTRKNFDPLQCDICPNKVDNVSNLECHHIIPWEVEGPDTLLNYAMLCKSCHKKFSHDPNENKRIQLINELKLRSTINKKKFTQMIRDKDLKKFHLDYLLRRKYIHSVDYLDLVKLFKIEVYRKSGKWKSKSDLSEHRWGRAMSTMKKKFADKCDAGCNNIDVETHHIIPKSQQIPRHKNKILKGPESPYNYAFICSKCHDAFDTTNTLTNKQKKIIEELKKKEVVSRGNVYQMILDDHLNIDQLDFLKVDNYISINDYNWLKKKIKLRDYYRSN